MAQKLPAGLFLDGRDAVMLDAVLRSAVAGIADRHGAVPGLLVEIAEEVRRVATEFRANVLVEAGSGTGLDDSGSVAAASVTTDRLSVRSAARLAGTSESYLRRLARKGVLDGMRGPTGGWVLDGSSFVAWLAERQRHQDEAA